MSKRRIARYAALAAPLAPLIALRGVPSASSVKALTLVPFVAGGIFAGGLLATNRMATPASRKALASQRKVGARQVDVLLMSSNGAGLGHLTRLYALRRRLRVKSAIYTLSAGYKKLNLRADQLTYFPSAGTLQIDARSWNELLAQHFSAHVAVVNPAVVVFDGTYIYHPVAKICREMGINLVWLQRGFWKPEVDASSTQRHNASKFVDDVLVPGDFAGQETVDFGPGVRVKKLNPISIYTSEEAVSGVEARAALGLSADKKYVLIQLGAGVINQIEGLRETAISAVRALGGEWEPVVTYNPLSQNEGPKKVHSLSVYPIGKYLRAFDFVVSAAGYNSTQESIALNIPLILVPNAATQTDDQEARAEGVAAQGFALTARTKAELYEAIAAMASEERRIAMSKAQIKAGKADGAEQAARWIEETYF